MRILLQKLFVLFIIATVWSLEPVQAQKKSRDKTGKYFIGKGKFLTGFSLGFINASREDFNQEFEREFTRLVVQVDGLYFLNNRIGVGPLLGYRFRYRDLEDPFITGDIDTRYWEFEFGAKGGWYISTRKLFGSSAFGNSQFFIDGGLSWLRSRFQNERFSESEPDYQFGYQLGTGFLFPIGGQIAFETKLGFQSRRQEYTLTQREPNGGFTVARTETKWLKEVSASIGFKVMF